MQHISLTHFSSYNWISPQMPAKIMGRLFIFFILGLAPAAWWIALLVIGRIRVIPMVDVNDPIRWRGKYTNDQSECSIASIKMFEKYELYFLSISCWACWLWQAIAMFLFLRQCIKYQWRKADDVTTDDVRFGFLELESVRVFGVSAVAFLQNWKRQSVWTQHFEHFNRCLHLNLGSIQHYFAHIQVSAHFTVCESRTGWPSADAHLWPKRYDSENGHKTLF